MFVFGHRSWPPWLLLGGLFVLWAIVIHQLGAQWSVYKQYHYGWGVPLLSLYLLRERWKTRPLANPGKPFVPSVVLIIAALLFWPTRILHEANPVWRLTSWALGLEVVAITLALLWLVAGARWVRHFGFAVLFFLVAIPWPTQLEIAVIQNLTRVNSSVVLEALHLWGTPSVQTGNLIELPNGIVEIEEACSGINSLQTTIMISLFLGELFAFPCSRRIALILISIGAAFIGNILRTFALVQISATAGMESLHQWHDAIGLLILGVTFLLVLLACVLLKPGTARPEIPVPSSPMIFSPVNATWQCAFVFWICVVELSCEGWYRAHERQSEKPLAWRISPPASEQPGDPAILAGAKRQLQYDNGQSIRWTDSDGSNWQLYSFEWFPSRNLATRMKVQLSQSHRPEICLPATGITLKESLGRRERHTGPLRLPFRDFTFNYNGRPVFVYFCVWDQATQMGLAANFREDTAQRIRAALRGSRNYGQRSLEIVVWGYRSKDQADDALQKKLSEIIHFSPG